MISNPVVSVTFPTSSNSTNPVAPKPEASLQKNLHSPLPPCRRELVQLAGRPARVFTRLVPD